MRALATTLSLLLTSSILPLSSPLLGQPVPVRAFDVPALQSFDALGPDGVAAPPGWRAGSSEVTLTRSLQTGSVHSTDPGAYNVQGTDQTDRAMGFLQAKGRAGMIQVRLLNATGSSVDAISIAFDAVQWRFSSDTRAQSGLELLFSADGETFVSLGERFSYHAAPDLDFRPLVSRNQSVRISAHVSGRWILPSVLPASAEFVLRWRSTNSQIDGVGFAVDNVRLTLHPVLPTADGDGFATVHNPLLQGSDIFYPGISQPVVLRMRGRPGGAIGALTVVLPAEWSIGPSGSVRLDGPAFQDATVELDGERIIVRGASLTDTCTGSVLLGGTVPPSSAPAGSAIFRVFTSTAGGAEKEIQESPKGILLVAIDSLRDRPPSRQAEIAIEGTLLCPYSLDDTQGEFFLDNNGSGIRVIVEEDDLDFLENQRLLVRGQYVEDRSRTTVLATQVYPLGTGRPVSRRPSSIREIITDPRHFEGSLVILRNVRKVRSTASAWPPMPERATRYFLTDGEGRDSLLLSVHSLSGLADSPEPRYPLTLRGIVKRVEAENMPGSRLAIVPRSLADINPVLTPAAPELRSPAKGEMNLSLVPTLDWETVSDASRYHLQLSNDTTLTLMLAEDSLLASPSYRSPQLASDGSYFWRVRAINGDGAGPFSEWRQFSTVAHPTVRIVEPDPGQIVGASSVVLRVSRSGFWYEGQKDAPVGLMDFQTGFLKVSVNGVVQSYAGGDSLWVVRLARGENTITTELVDRDRRALRPSVMDTMLLTVSEDAWIMRAYTGSEDVSSPLVHHSSSLSLRPELTVGAALAIGSAVPVLAVTVDEHPRARDSTGTVSLTALAPGVHRIRVEVIDGVGAPLSPRVFDEFSLAIPDSAPYLRISSPASGDTLGATGSKVILERRNLRLRTSSEVDTGGTRFGAFVVSVNGSAVDTSQGDTLALGWLSAGIVTVRVEALSVDGVPLDPPVFDEVRVVARVSAASEKLFEELKSYVLEQNYPNPFNAETEIRFSIPTAGHVSVRVFNLLGQEVALLLDSDMDAGTHHVRWDGLNDSGKRVSSGIYMVRLQSGPYVGTRRMLLVK